MFLHKMGRIVLVGSLLCGGAARSFAGGALDRDHLAVYNALEAGSTCSSATMGNALTQIGSATRTLLLTATDASEVGCSWTLTAPVTIPANVTLWVPAGVKVALGGFTLTIGGPAILPDPNFTTGAGTVIFQYANWGTEASYASYQRGFVTAGCLHPPSGSTSATLTACTGRTSSGIAVVQASTGVTYTGGDGRYWLVLYKNTTDTVSGWTRVGSTALLWKVASLQPAWPAHSVPLLQATVTGGAITRVRDMRPDNPTLGPANLLSPLYGVVGDCHLGTGANDGPGIQAAINNAAGRGVALFLPKAPGGGAYCSSQTLYIGYDATNNPGWPGESLPLGDFHLYGEGPAVGFIEALQPSPSILVSEHGTALWLADNAQLILNPGAVAAGTSSHPVTLENLTVWGKTPGTFLVDALNISDHLLSSVTIIQRDPGATGKGLRVQCVTNTSGGGAHNFNTLNKVIISRNVDDVVDGGSVGLHIDNNVNSSGDEEACGGASTALDSQIQRFGRGLVIGHATNINSRVTDVRWIGGTLRLGTWLVVTQYGTRSVLLQGVHLERQSSSAIWVGNDTINFTLRNSRLSAGNMAEAYRANGLILLSGDVANIEISNNELNQIHNDSYGIRRTLSATAQGFRVINNAFEAYYANVGTGIVLDDTTSANLGNSTIADNTWGDVAESQVLHKKVVRLSAPTVEVLGAELAKEQGRVSIGGLLQQSETSLAAAATLELTYQGNAFRLTGASQTIAHINTTIGTEPIVSGTCVVLYTTLGDNVQTLKHGLTGSDNLKLTTEADFTLMPGNAVHMCLLNTGWKVMVPLPPILGYGPHPPANCRPPALWIDTDSGDTSNCLTTTAPHLCLCTSPDTWQSAQ